MSTELAIRDEVGYFATLDEIRALVEQIQSVEDAKDLADRARAAQVWAERAGLEQTAVNLAVVAKMWAERRAGELIEVDTGRPEKRSPRVTLSEIGVTKMQSHRWQKLAKLPIEFYEAAVAEALEAGRISLNEVFRRADRAARQAAVADAELELVTGLIERGGPTCSVAQADLREFDPGPVDAIVTDPPYITADAVELYAALGQFAARTLNPGGALVVMTWQPILPDVLRVLALPELRYRWVVAWVSGSNETTVDHARRVQDRWKPVVVFHRGEWAPKAPMLTDVVFSARDQSKSRHPWQQDLAGFRQLVRGVSLPGDTVCDPFLGSGTTALAALAENRHFVGCDIDAAAITETEKRLAA